MTRSPNDIVGMTLATALDWIKSRLIDPEGWRLAIYLGRGDDPHNAWIVGNATAPELAAAISLLAMDGEDIGTVNRNGMAG